ncbi:receptor like protein 1 [Euphorbia peplus]|nr:receptor like protein 1 [Euphorbia peplus]
MKKLGVIMILIVVLTKELGNNYYCEGCFEDERLALLELKPFFKYCNKDGSTVARATCPWGIGYNCCEWEGVNCSSSSGRVTHLDLEGYAITTWFSRELYLNVSLFLPFHELQTLNLQSNVIVGSIHSQGFGGLSRLENLESLDLSGNSFDDSSLSSIGNISSLKSLYLNNTGLNSIDDIQGLLRLENLEHLDLSDNSFDSSIFSFISGLSSLKSLGLQNQEFTGSTVNITGLKPLENLEHLDLSDNSLDINIFSFISGLSSLKSLQLRSISLSETIHSKDLARLTSLKKLESLDLSWNVMRAEDIKTILSSFTNILSLKSLNLNNNDFNSTTDIQGLPRLKNLEYLDLGWNKFNSNIFSILSQVSSLKSLYLSFNDLTEIEDSKGLSKLVNLELLDISGNNFNNSNILISIAALSSLKTLDLSDCQLKWRIDLQGKVNLSKLEEMILDYSIVDEDFFDSIGALPSLKRLSLYLLNSYHNFTLSTQGFPNLEKLEYLDMSSSTLNSSILEHIGKLISLKTLVLNYCGLSGTLPPSQGLCNLRNLEELDLSNNKLHGNLPSCIRNLTSLQILDLSDNYFSGNISVSPLRILTSLQDLKFSSNLFRVPLSLEPFFNHSDLKYLDARSNQNYEDVQVHDLTPSFQLETLLISGHGNGGNFPKFLRHQHDLQHVDFSNFHLKDEFPHWLLTNNTKLMDLNLANTSISGTFLLPIYTPHKYLQALDISKNYLRSTIPSQIGQILPQLSYLNLSENSLFGGMPASLGKMSMLGTLDLSSNELSGEIPEDLEVGDELQLGRNAFTGNIPRGLLECTRLSVLDASDNHLSGRIPEWIANMSSLKVLELSRNGFDKLPSRVCPSLTEVYLSENRLQGSLRTAFYDCHNLLALDLSRNSLSGKIPEWIGEIPRLSYLLMSYNNLEGEIPSKICDLQQLSLLDLSNNNLSGHVTPCIRAGSKYSHPEPPQYKYVNSYSGFMKHPLEFTTKNKTYPFQGSILMYISGIDLSCNNLSGKIPIEIGNLTKLQALNLSHNSLIGPIPESFSNLTQIESLDLSYNNLDGKIPSRLLGLNFLSHFSVAHNNLSGRTPERVAQFGTFENTSYEGNPSLCGPPLLKSCSPQVPRSPYSEEEEEEDGRFMDMEVFYASCVVSYIVVLCTFGVVLHVNPYWRRRWFYMIEVIMINCYYFIEDHVLPLFKLRASQITLS